MPDAAGIQMEPVEQGGKVYLPIRLDCLRADTVPDFDLHLLPEPGQPFVLYCERNTPFSSGARARLARTRVTRLYVPEAQRADYLRYLAGHISDILDDAKMPLREKATILYDSAQAVVEEVLQNPSAPANIQRGKDIVHQTVDFMTSRDFLLENLLRNISCDFYLYTHSVNVVAYSVLLAVGAGFRDQATLREIANGALLHDVGKSTIDDAILNKTSALNNREWELMQGHPTAGHEVLLNTGSLGEIALDIVLHHHERLTGDGYPDCLAKDDISPFVRIVSIADIFDALTTDRYHQRGVNTFAAFKEMHQEMGLGLDRDLMKVFVEAMGGGKS